MPRKFTLCAFLLLILACGRKESLTFESIQLMGDRCANCPDITISLPKAVEGSKLAKSINTGLREEVIALLSFEDSLDIQTLNHALSSFRRGFEQIQRLYPDETPEWKAEIFGEISFEDKNWISIKLSSYIFTGGAHGYGSVRYLNFDKRKGKELEPWELFRDKIDFLRFAEQKFRQQEHIPVDQPINSTGFMFEGDHFYLPENIGLCEEGIKLHYNQYEVASYADGPIEITLPFKEVLAFLNFPGES